MKFFFSHIGVEKEFFGSKYVTILVHAVIRIKSGSVKFDRRKF
jgi:hypothetical protein